MRKKRAVIIAIACVLLLLPGLLLLRKSTVPLIASGKTIAVAKEPFFLPWKESKLSVYAGNTNVFSLWEDFFDFPICIYPFADGKRFLCIYDYDVSVLVFVVDFNPTAANFVQSPAWPTDGEVRHCLAQGMTNVVTNTKGVVRLPTYPELQETSSNFVGAASGKIRNASFGVYNFGWPNQQLLSELSTNRTSVWP